MTAYSNTFEGGSNGTTITTGNSGGTSGDAFDTVTVGTTGTLAFDTTHAAHGTLALKVQQGVTSAASFVEKTFPSASATVAIRLYMYVTANPGVTVDVGKVLSGSTIRARLRLTTTGKLVVSDSANASVITQTGTVPLNAWFRVEVQFPALSATVGQVTLARFSTADSTVATETATSTALQNFGGTADRVRYGVTTAAATIGPFWLDDVAENDTGAAIGSSLPTYFGTAAQTVPSFTQAAAGTFTKPTYTGTGASTVPSFTQAAAGTVAKPVYTGTAAQTLPAFTQQATGASTAPVYTGTAATVLPSLTQAAVGTVAAPVYTGAGASVLAGFTQVATGTVAAPVFTGIAITSLPALTQAAAGTSGGGAANVRATLTATDRAGGVLAGSDALVPHLTASSRVPVLVGADALVPHLAATDSGTVIEGGTS